MIISSQALMLASCSCFFVGVKTPFFKRFVAITELRVIYMVASGKSKKSKPCFKKVFINILCCSSAKSKTLSFISSYLKLREYYLCSCMAFHTSAYTAIRIQTDCAAIRTHHKSVPYSNQQTLSHKH